MIATVQNKSITDLFWKVISSLSEKEQIIMKKRVGMFWKRETLQDIWLSFNPPVTRERIRQLETNWIKKLQKIHKSDLFNSIQSNAIELLKIHWWILVEDKLISVLIKELNIEKSVNPWMLEIIVQSGTEILKSKQKQWCKLYFYFNNFPEHLVESIHKEAVKILRRKKDIMEKMELYEIIRNKFVWKVKLKSSLIDAILDINLDIVKWENNFIWLSAWKILNPKTLKEKVMFIFKKEWVPMHFVDVSNKISFYLWETVKINTVHNELIKNPVFILIWRGIYALKEWWFKPWNVKDVIVWVLTKSKTPMTAEEIAKSVMKVREVKRTTVYMNLQDRSVIERVWRNRFQLVKK